MLGKILKLAPHAINGEEGTGTFPDGIFHLAIPGQSSFDQSHSLRRSYGQDSVVATKFERSPAVFG